MPVPQLVVFPNPPLGSHMTGIPLVELKLHLVLFVPKPPGPITCRGVLNTYFQHFGDAFVDYSDTWVSQERIPWDERRRETFLSNELPQLRKGPIWGYSFWDGKKIKSRMLMFHGFRPVSQPGRASFFRFEFESQLDPIRIRDFTIEILDFVECVSGYGGYFFSGLPQGEGAVESLNQVYAWARRYWGVEVEDINASAASLLDGFKCVSWLTVIGPGIAKKNPESLNAAMKVATWVETATGGTVLQAGPHPVIGDRNRREDLSNYEILAKALEPLQVKQHVSFGDAYHCKWDEAETGAWLRRFTDPAGFSGIVGNP